MKRSRIEMAMSIMQCIRKHPQFPSSRICAYEGIPYKTGRLIFKALEKGGFIKKLKLKHGFMYTTERKATELINLWEQMVSDLPDLVSKSLNNTSS